MARSVLSDLDNLALQMKNFSSVTRGSVWLLATEILYGQTRDDTVANALDRQPRRDPWLGREQRRYWHRYPDTVSSHELYNRGWRHSSKADQPGLQHLNTIKESLVRAYRLAQLRHVYSFG